MLIAVIFIALVLLVLALRPRAPIARLKSLGLAESTKPSWRSRLAGAKAAERDRSKTRAIEVATGLAAAVEAGLAPRAALNDVVRDLDPGSDEALLRDASHAAIEGNDVATTLMSSALAHWRAIGVAWRVGEESGAAFAPVLDRVAGALRTEQNLAREARSALATAQATSRLLAVLPFFGVLLGRGIGGNPMKFLISGPAGFGCLAIGLTFEITGLLWTRRILKKAGGVA